MDSNASNTPALKRVFVIFNGQGGCFVSMVHIWNGPIPIGYCDNLHITGNHNSILSEPDLNASTIWESDRSDPFITTGLGTLYTSNSLVKKILLFS
jgi:hypothetical protein